MEPVVCPICGSKSLTFGNGGTTMMGWAPFTDEQGNYHSHNPNRVMQGYSCVNCNHKFSQKVLDSCWCGWTSK